MEGWQRRRSAPVGVLLAGAIALLVTATVGVIFYLSVIRSARGLPAYTAGLPWTTVAFPLPRRAAYHAYLDGPRDRETPSGMPSAVHRWRVFSPTAPDVALCAGEATDHVLAEDSTGTRRVLLPVPPTLFIRGAPQAVPPRVAATCPGARPTLEQARALVYREEYVPRHAAVELVACADGWVGQGTPDDAQLGPCSDGAPSRIYPRESIAVARARTRAAMFRVAGFAAAFAALSFALGWTAIRRFDQLHGRGV